MGSAIMVHGETPYACGPGCRRPSHGLTPTPSHPCAHCGATPARCARCGQVVARELPQDPANQLLLGLYFFLAGMLVRSHPHMWLLPATSCAMALLSALAHGASKLLISSYA